MKKLLVLLALCLPGPLFGLNIYTVPANGEVSSLGAGERLGQVFQAPSDDYVLTNWTLELGNSSPLTIPLFATGWLYQWNPGTFSSFGPLLWQQEILVPFTGLGADGSTVLEPVTVSPVVTLVPGDSYIMQTAALWLGTHSGPLGLEALPGEAVESFDGGKSFGPLAGRRSLAYKALFFNPVVPDSGSGWDLSLGLLALSILGWQTHNLRSRSVKRGPPERRRVRYEWRALALQKLWLLLRPLWR